MIWWTTSRRIIFAGLVSIVTDAPKQHAGRIHHKAKDLEISIVLLVLPEFSVLSVELSSLKTLSYQINILQFYVLFIISCEFHLLPYIQ